MESLYSDAVELLKRLIAIPSFSREENGTADILEEQFKKFGFETVTRLHNNVWSYNRWYDESKPTILLNSHHDTVRPNAAYTRDPFVSTVEGDKLYGLGSNDAGASVVSLISLFRHFYERQDMKYNFCLAISAEEEVNGKAGLESILPHIGEIDFAIVGEPTLMQLAIAERGLMVVDCVAKGKAGHAARNEGDNAIYRAMKDIEWIANYRFEKVSPMLGEVKMTTTIINAGTQHNVVPAECTFTTDIRLIEDYSHEDVLEVMRANMHSTVTPRSTRLKPSSIPSTHPIVVAGVELGLTTYGSPTTSDQVILSVPSVKVGVGESGRSHSADEFVHLSEIKQGIDLYIKMLDKIV